MRILTALLACLLCAGGALAAQPLVLWYGAPAAAWPDPKWEREGMPIGNGAMGAMVSGGIAAETLQFNEKTLWTGGPGSPGFDRGLAPASQKEALAKVQALIAEKGKASPEEIAAILGHPVTGYGDYQSFGEVKLTYPGLVAGEKNYRRELDISKAVARVAFTSGGIRYTREYFASYPAGVIVMRLAANKPGRIAFTVALNAPDNRSVTRSAKDGRVTEVGALKDNGLRYEAQLQVITKGGVRRDNDDGSVTVAGADSAVLILAAGTNYAVHYPDYRGADPHTAVTAKIAAAAKQGYQKLRTAHIGDYQKLFDRVGLDLNGKPSAVPTDALLKAYGSGDDAADRWLEALHFQFGRYLLIASSRAGSLPANLQGVWNPSATPPWNGDYHVNINLQMNYWLADLTGLPEAAAPFYDFVDGMLPPGRLAAQRIFGAGGWTVFLNTDIWGFSGVISWPTAFWQPEAGAWLASQYFDHYRFTLDKAFLETRAYPVMKGAAELWLDALVRDPRDGKLVVSPSYSPEHGPFSAGAAMSQQIVYELFAETAQAARIIGDDAFAQKLEAAYAQLDPGLAIGKFGQIKEWKEDWDDPKDEHRHTSHLYALHPGQAISPLKTPALAEAAKVTLMARGDSTTSHGETGTGWSKAWKMNFWARLYDGDHAHRLFAQLLKENTMANFWDAYVGPPFQIDANFGSTAGVVEMLLQSQSGVIDILPALPKAWPSGQVRGLHARGDVSLDMSWRDNCLINVTLASGRDGEIALRNSAFKSGVSLIDVTHGKTIRLIGEGDTRRFYAHKSTRYQLTPVR